MRQSLIDKATMELPKIKFPLPQSEIVEKFAGIIKAQPSQNDLDNDERRSKIWNR